MNANLYDSFGMGKQKGHFFRFAGIGLVNLPYLCRFWAFVFSNLSGFCIFASRFWTPKG